MNENFLNLRKKDINQQIQETQSTPVRKKPNRPTLRHIISNSQKSKTRNLESSKRKRINKL